MDKLSSFTVEKRMCQENEENFMGSSVLHPGILALE